MIPRSLFHSSFWLTLLIIGSVTLLCHLGCWQLSRYTQKTAWLAETQRANAALPLTAEQLLQPKTPNARFATVAFNSKIDNEHVVLLDNKIIHGKVGYHVYVFAELNEKTLILINRGWIPLGSSRKNLPLPPPIIGEVAIEGYLDFAYRNPFILTSLESNTVQWPLRMQQLDITLLAKEMGKELFPMSVILNKNSPYAFEIEAPEAWLTPERHRGYAIQWFALAATLLLLYLFAISRVKKS